MRLVVAIALLVLLVPAPRAGAAADDLSLLPPDGAIAGWNRTGNVKRFTQQDLYGYIDGGAELFLEFGFEQLTVQKYVNGKDEYTVEAYRMTDPPAATGVYLMKAGKPTPVATFREMHTANKYQLMFARDRYFVIVNNTSGKDALVPLETKFASFVSSKLPPAQPIPEMQALPKAGLLPGSARLVRGAYGLQSVYTLGEGDILQLGRKLVAVSGEYKTPQGAYTLVVANYPTPAQAKQAFDYLRGHLDQYLKIVDQSPSRFVFEDYAKKFGVASLAGSHLEIRVKLVKKP